MAVLTEKEYLSQKKKKPIKKSGDGSVSETVATLNKREKKNEDN